MCCVQYEMLSCSLKDFISFVVDAFAQAYCSHLKRTNTFVLLSVTLPFTIYLSLGCGMGRGDWKCTICTMSGAVSDTGCIGQSLLFFPKVWSLEQLS